MRLLWYAGTSTALATGVVAYAFNQRANFYSAMVYLSQNNLSLMILINLVLLVYGSFVWGLQRLCYGPLRPVEVEQLYEKAWFAVTETCLAMTIFREEVGAWFLVMFTALVTGKVWEWIGEGRVEILEQQPPANPRLFHTRLSISLILSVVYDTWLFFYTVNSVIQQARPNMMVMFLFEFAILAACSFRTAFRYVLSLIEADIVKKQTRQIIDEKRKQIHEQRADIMRRRESDDQAEAEAAQQEELPQVEIDEMDIEVPGWESKGQWVLSLDLLTDFVKLGIYSAFFAILMMFYGLPIHIMRDLFLTARSFVKRLGAILRYRKALQDMNKYADANVEDLQRENTCIICREEMRPWDPDGEGAVERSRPKKLPCGHILHYGCLKSWLERQQVCPTCRRSVVIDAAGPNGEAPAPGANAGAVAGAGVAGPGQAVPDNGGANAGQPPQGRPRMRVFQLGPLRLGFAQGNVQNIHEMAQQLRFPPAGPNPVATPAIPAASGTAANSGAGLGSIVEVQTRIYELSQRIQQEMNALQATQAELQILYALTTELNRLRQIQQQVSNPPVAQLGQPGFNASFTPMPQQPVIPPTIQGSPIPNLPPRVNPPAVTRHGGAPYSNAIPAGSHDLPEGVTIPPGWSLLPLQRLDGQPVQQSTWTQQTVQPVEVQHQPNQSSILQNANVMHASSDANVAATHSTTEESSSSNVHEGVGHYENSRRSSPMPLTAGTQREPPDVAAPTPVMPNWGGAAQLFADGDLGGPSSQAATTNESDPKVNETLTMDTTSSAAIEQDQGSDQENPSSSDAKGKAKAVTVEDAEDD